MVDKIKINVLQRKTKYAKQQPIIPKRQERNAMDWNHANIMAITILVIHVEEVKNIPKSIIPANKFEK